MAEQVDDVNRQIREKVAALKADPTRGDRAYEATLEDAVRKQKTANSNKKDE